MNGPCCTASLVDLTLAVLEEALAKLRCLPFFHGDITAKLEAANGQRSFALC